MSVGFPYSSVGKESACNAGDLGSIPGSGRSPGEGNGNPLQYSCLENLMDRGAWRATVHGVTRVGHDLATKLPTILGPSLVAQRVKCLPAMWETRFHPWIGKIPRRRKCDPLWYSCLENPTGRERSLVGYSPWGCKDSDTTE